MQACSNRETWPFTKTGLPSASFGNNSLNFLNPPTLALTLQPINPNYGLPAQLRRLFRHLALAAESCCNLRRSKQIFITPRMPTSSRMVSLLVQPSARCQLECSTCQGQDPRTSWYLQCASLDSIYFGVGSGHRLVQGLPENATAEASNLTDQNNCNTLSCLNSALIFPFP